LKNILLYAAFLAFGLINTVSAQGDIKINILLTIGKFFVSWEEIEIVIPSQI
jgi:hypothetical protein